LSVRICRRGGMPLLWRGHMLCFGGSVYVWRLAQRRIGGFVPVVLWPTMLIGLCLALGGLAHGRDAGQRATRRLTERQLENSIQASAHEFSRGFLLLKDPLDHRDCLGVASAIGQSPQNIVGD